MGDQTKRGIIEQSVTIRWMTLRATATASAVTLVLGYLASIVGAHHLTIVNFSAFTALNALWAVLLWWTYTSSDRAKWLPALSMLVLSILTFIIGLFIATGIEFNFLLYFVTVGNYFVFLTLRNALIATALLYLANIANLVLVDGWKSFDSGWLTTLAGFAFVAAFSLSNRLLQIERDRSGRLLRELEASNRELEAAHTQLQAYASEVEELAVARERTRMARDIHDTLGHYLTIMNIQLETINKLLPRDPARAMSEVEEARQVAAQSMQEVRNAVAALRPTSIATLNLPDALTQLGNEFSVAAPTTELTLDLDTSLPPLSAELQLALYRAAQEALTNVRKHAQATKVLARLRYENDTLELVIRDNGSAIPDDRSPQRTGGFGLIGLRERIELLGGQVTYGPVEPTGYRVAVHMCIPQPGAAQSSSKETPIEQENRA